MRSRPDYPIISPVESVLISNKLPTKLLSDTKCLVQSKHQNEVASFVFTVPSDDAQKKLEKICPLSYESVGSGPNANLKAFVVLTFEHVFDEQDKLYQKFFIEKITNQVPKIMKRSIVKNHKHEEIVPEDLVRVVSGFLKTLSNKKLKNPQIFDLQKELQNLSIILDYTVIMFRAILTHFSQQKANDFTQTVKDSDSYTILSEYFDINFIRKDNFYLFEDNQLFIFKSSTEYVIGKYRPSGMNQTKKQNIDVETQQKYEKNCKMEIMECSMESGSHLVSSRHGDEETPYFNALNGQQFLFRSNQRKQEFKQNPILQKQSQSMENSQPSAKCFDSKSSELEVNIYSEDRDKFFNNKYKSGKISEDSNKERQKNSEKTKTKDKSFPKFQKKNDDKIFMSNNPNNFQKIELIKKVSSDKCLNALNMVSEENQEKTDSFKTGKSNPSTELTKEKEITVQSTDHLIHQDYVFEWKNEERRLRRVETICYKTCSTCHRRFYRNQIQLNVIEIKVEATPKIPQIKEQTNQKLAFVSPKHAPEFLNKKIKNKENKLDPKIYSPRLIGNSPQIQQKEVRKIPQFSWLNKRSKTQNHINAEILTSEQTLFQNTPKKTNINSNAQLNSIKQGESANNILNTKNLFSKEFIGTKQQIYEKDFSKAVNFNENKRPSCQKMDTQPRIKSFFTLKSQKQLEKIKSIDKFEFFQGKISKEGAFKSDKNMKGEINKGIIPIYRQTNGPNTQLEKRKDLVKDKNVGTGKKDGDQSIVQKSKSADKKALLFVKKNSLNIALDLIMNN